MHGMTKAVCLKTLKSKLSNLQTSLSDGKLEPNYPNGTDHIFHVNVGAGSHSIGPAVLKYAVNSWLKGNYGDDFYPDITHG
jgi:hypothetical protein